MEPVEVMLASFTKEDFKPPPSKAKSSRKKPWAFLFCPKDFDDDISLEQFQISYLPEDQMLHHGRQATLVRQTLLERASKYESEQRDTPSENKEYSQHLVKKLYRNLEGNDSQWNKAELR